MRNTVCILLFPFLSALPGCTFHMELPDYTGESSYQLAEFTAPGGGTEIYELDIRPDRDPAIAVIREEPGSYPEFGLQVEELDRERAEKLGLRPFTGLLVGEVTPRSAAAKAGIVEGDVLLAVDDEEVYLLKAYNRILDGISTARATSFRFHGTRGTRQLTPEIRPRTRRSRTEVALESPPDAEPSRYSGARFQALPVDHARRIFGDDRSAIVVTGVVIGSPAYLAGLRVGDMVERVDGRRPPKLAEFLRRERELGERQEPIDLEVSRENGRAFATTLYLREYGGVSRVRVPLVFHSRASARITSWSLLPFGMLAGYSNAYAPSKTRDSQQIGSYSMLLGLIRFSWSPQGSRTRLLWFISFG